MEQIIVGHLVFLKGDPAWTDGRSNVGRFLKLASPDKVKVFPKDMVPTTYTPEKEIAPYNDKLS